MNQKEIEIGDKIKVYEFRSNKTVQVTALGSPFYDQDYETYFIPIEYNNGDEWYAIWDEMNQRWESGEI